MAGSLPEKLMNGNEAAAMCEESLFTSALP